MNAYLSIPESLHFFASPVLSGRKFPPMVNIENIDVPVVVSKYSYFKLYILLTIRLRHGTTKEGL